MSGPEEAEAHLGPAGRDPGSQCDPPADKMVSLLRRQECLLLGDGGAGCPDGTRRLQPHGHQWQPVGMGGSLLIPGILTCRLPEWPP